MSNTQKYIPSEESLKFIAFVRAIGLEDHANAELHYKLADRLFGGDKKLLIESFRGSAKSSISEYFCIYCAVLGKIPGAEIPFNFVVFVGDAMENGTKSFMRNIRSKVQGSDFLQTLLTIKRATDSEIELINVDGHQTNFKGFGAAGNIRGVRYAAENGKTYRPSFLLVDDVVTETSSSSETIRESISNNFWKALLPALDPNGMVVVIGTPQSEADLLHELKGQSTWSHHRFPICKRFPCTKEEFEGNWSDRFTYNKVKELYTMYKDAGKLNAFRQELFLEIIDRTNLLVDEDDIKWFDPTIVSANSNDYNIYISTDFATSTKNSADYSTMGVWAISNNNDWLLVDGQCKRQTMQENIDDLFDYVRKWKPLSVGIESSGQQGGFLSIIEEQKMKRNTWFDFARKPGSKEPGIRPIKDKVHRFVTGVQPKFKQGKIWLPKTEILEMKNPRLLELVQELVDELGKFTLAGGVKSLKHDDALDLLNQLSEMDKFVPSAESVQREYSSVGEAGSGIWMEIEDEEEFPGNSVVF